MKNISSLDILSNLISFDSTSCHSNLDLINYIADFLDQHGIQVELTYDESHQKANLFASIAGPLDTPGLVLSGHTDVVPVSDQNWHSDPFKLTRKENKLHARGSSDMKGFIAVCLALTPLIRQTKLKQPVHFAFSYDEEIGCVGVRGLLKELADKPIKPIACIVGEPTSMQPIRAHKGKLSVRCNVKGHTCHSSRIDEGVNAVEYAANIISYLQNLSFQLEKTGPFDQEFTPAYTSVHTGVIHGGSVLNIVPDHCAFDFEIRNIPNQDASIIFQEIKTYAREVLLPKMKQKNAKSDIVWQFLSNIPAFSTASEESLNQLCLALSDFQQSGKVSFGTEAGLFQELGMQAIVCGPGSINQAHKANEYIEVEQIHRCEDFLSQLIQRLTTAPIS